MKDLKKSKLNYINVILRLTLFLSFSFSFSQDKHLIDIDRSALHWYGYKVTGEHDGNVNVSSGYVTLDFNDYTVTDAYIKMDMNSITVSDIKSEKWNNKLVNHLKDDDFFSVSDFPFSSLKVLSKVSPDNLVVYKEEDKDSEVLYNCLVTIKGIENIIRVPITVSKLNGSFHTSGTVKLDRTLWNIKYKSQKYFASIGDRMIYDNFVISFSIYTNENK